MEYGKIAIDDFMEGVRRMRRLSDSIDQVFACVDRKNLRALAPSEREGEVVIALQMQCDGHSYGNRVNNIEGGVFYTTSGGLKFGWTKKFKIWSFDMDGNPRLDVEYTFYVFAKGDAFREGSRLRAALYGAGWDITEYPRPEPALTETKEGEALGEEELPPVPPKYKANLIDE